MRTLNKMKFWVGALLVGGLLTFTGCDDSEDEAPDLTIQALTATGTDLSTGEEVTVDLNGASSASDVPPNSVIEITFDRALDETTVSSAAFTLESENSSATVSATVSGEAVTIETAEELVRGTVYTLSVAATIAAEDGGGFASTSRSFTTAGRAPAVIPQENSMVVYVPFDGTVTDEGGHTILNDDVSFAEDRFGNFEASGDFNGTTNYVGVEYGDDMVNPSNTVSYWVKLPATEEYDTHVRAGTYVTMSLAGNQGLFHEFGRFDNGDIVTDYLKYFTKHINSGSAGGFIDRYNENKQEGQEPAGDKTFENDNISWLEENTGQWMHVVTTYDASQSKKSVYINGVLGTEWVFTTSEDGTTGTGDWTVDLASTDGDVNNNRNLYLGTGLPFWATLDGEGLTPNNMHAFKGQMDDFRMFSVALSDEEVQTLYDSEKP